MKPRRAAWLSARREIRERIRSRAFRISTLVQVLAVIAVAIGASLAGGSDSTTVEVGTIGQPGEEILRTAERIAPQADLEIDSESFESLAAARTAIEEGNVDFAVGGGTLLAVEGGSEEAEAILARSASEEALRSGLAREGIPPARATQLFASTQVSVETVSGQGGDSSGGGIAFIATLLLYLALIFCGYAVAGGVVEEKSTRVVELVINAISPRDLLAGKVFGIGLMGLAQLMLIVGGGLGVAIAMGELTLPPATGDTVLLALLYFILGFALYGCAFAVAGSIVSRQEDSGTTTSPVMILLVAAYILSLSVAGDPASTLAVVGTLFPPTAPMVVPARAAVGELPLEQLVASVVLMIAGCALLIWIAGRVYERTVLRMGAPVRFGELLRIFRAG